MTEKSFYSKIKEMDKLHDQNSRFQCVEGEGMPAMVDRIALRLYREER